MENANKKEKPHLKLIKNEENEMNPEDITREQPTASEHDQAEGEEATVDEALRNQNAKGKTGAA